jgi:hypothetical protein
VSRRKNENDAKVLHRHEGCAAVVRYIRHPAYEFDPEAFVVCLERRLYLSGRSIHAEGLDLIYESWPYGVFENDVVSAFRRTAGKSG